MRKVFFSAIIAMLLISLSGITSVVEAGTLRLNNNPQNLNRQPDWGKECVVVLTHDSPQVTLKSGTEGEVSTGTLPAGVAVVVDRNTRVAKWVAVCGNTVTAPTDWVPEGKYICSPGARYESACADTTEILSRLDAVQEGVDEANRKLDRLLEQVTPTASLPPPTIALSIKRGGKEVGKVKKGSSVEVEWNSTNADRCEFVSPSPTSVSSKEEAVGSLIFEIGEDTEFKIRCQGPGGIAFDHKKVEAKSNAGWIIGGIVAAGVLAAALSGGGGDNGGGQKEGPTIPE